MKTMTPSKYFIWLILIVGLIFRFGEYFAMPSLWADEAIVANRLSAYPFFKLAQIGGPAEINLGYPVGFLMVIQGVSVLFGHSEAVLRFIPFLCGILSLFLFAKLTQKIFSNGWAAFALFLFAVARNLVYYTNEVKPYSGDVLFAVVIWFWLVDFKWEDLNFKKALILGGLGVGAFIFSFPVFFLLTGIGLGVMVDFFRTKNVRSLRYIILALFTWLLGFMMYYALSLQYFVGDKQLAQVWQGNYLPVRSGLFPCIQWLLVSFKRVFAKGLDLPAAAAGLASLLGVFYMFKKKKGEFLALVVPILFMILLSVPGLYPFEGRVILFLFPAFIIIMTRGVQIICDHDVLRNNKFFILSIVVFFLFFPVLFSVRQFMEVSGPEEIKPVLSYIQKSRQKGDRIAVYDGSRYAYKFYAPNYGLDQKPLIVSRKQIIAFMNELKRKKEEGGAQRIWFVFSHVKHDQQNNERLIILKGLNGLGQQMDQFAVKVLPHSIPRIMDNDISASTVLYKF